MSKRSKKHADPGDQGPATEESIFKAINELRKNMQLPSLKWKPEFQMITEHYAETGEFPNLEEKDFITLSKFCFRDSFDGQTTNELLEAWLGDPSKRPVLLAPGNYGLVSKIEFQPEEEDGEDTMVQDVYLVVLVVSVYR